MTFIGVGEWLARRQELTPEKIALVDFETQTRLTYRELNRRAQALATILQEQYAIQPGDRVAALALNSVEYLDAFFAVALLGAILVPLNWRLSARELGVILTDCEPKLLLHDEQHSERAKEVTSSLNLPTQLLSMSAFPGANAELAARSKPFQSRDGEEPMLILYTSGTTGTPRGAMLSHRMITWNAVNTQISWGLRDTDITPTFAPFFHAGGWNVLTTPIFHCGGTIVLLGRSDPATILRATAQEKCTILFAVPTVFQMLMAQPDFATIDLSAVRFCIAGGSSCPIPLIKSYAARGLEFRQGYGLTEVGVNCFSLAPEDALRKAGSVGRPVFHSRARVVDDDDRTLGPDEVGELVLAGPHVCSGYWKRPEATEEAYRGGWWHTGDLVRYDQEGYYFIVGRKKDMFISGGENVYPAEVEAVLITHPQIVDAAVIAQPDPKWGEVGLAVVVARESESLTSEAVIAHCNGKLARFKIPRAVVFVDELPRNAMGKVIKKELHARYVEQAT